MRLAAISPNVWKRSLAAFKTSRLNFSRPLFFISFSALFIIIFSAIWLSRGGLDAFKTTLRHLILNELNHINFPSSGTEVDTIYILGGSQSSLEYKYKKGAAIYRKGICRSIWILSRPGKTEYSISLGRNLTNDEWSVLKLREFGVPREHIEPIRIKEGFFGTLSEAKSVSSIINNRGYNDLLLITSHDHTYRTKISFDKFLKDHNVSVYVQSSDEWILLRHLIVEFIKLKVYQYLLIRAHP